MASYNYKAIDYRGRALTGVIEAPNLESAKNELREKNLVIVFLEKKVSQLNILDRALSLVNRVGNKELVFFSRQLAVMVQATVPLVRALKILVKQTENSYFKEVVGDIASEVDGGAKLSKALGRYPKVFDRFFVHMIRAGETTGRLDEVLDYLAEQREKDYALANKVKGAMVYPAFIVLAMVGIGTVMMIKVVPQLTGVLVESGAEIHWTTRILMTTSQIFVNYWWLILLIIIFLGILLRIYRQSAYGQWYLDLVRLKMPVFGAIFQKIYLARFSRGLANLLAAGVPITRSLEIMAEVVNNKVYRDLIYKASREVEVGNPLSEVFLNDENVPPMVGSMLSVGEETGKLSAVLKKVADFYALEVEAAALALVNLVEPVIMILLGGAVLFLVLSILMPMYSLTSSI